MGLLCFSIWFLLGACRPSWESWSWCFGWFRNQDWRWARYTKWWGSGRHRDSSHRSSVEFVENLWSPQTKNRAHVMFILYLRFNRGRPSSSLKWRSSHGDRNAKSIKAETCCDNSTLVPLSGSVSVSMNFGSHELNQKVLEQPSDDSVCCFKWGCF